MRERVRRLRQVLKLTQKQLGKVIGISNASVSDIENGKSKLTDRNISLICDKLNVNENWLRTGEGEMFNTENAKSKYELLIDNLMENEKEFPKKVFKAFGKLGANEWRVLEKIIDMINEE